MNIHADRAIEASAASGVESRYAWMRLGASTLLSAIGNAGMWSVVVVLPALQSEFGVARADASLPYTLTMIGFACGSVVVGRLVDRFGIVTPAVVGTLALALGYVAAGHASSLWIFAIVNGALIGFGGAATFGPLIADISHWFVRRSGIAVAICATGNSLAGTVWPPLIQHFTKDRRAIVQRLDEFHQRRSAETERGSEAVLGRPAPVGPGAEIRRDGQCKKRPGAEILRPALNSAREIGRDIADLGDRSPRYRRHGTTPSAAIIRLCLTDPPSGPCRETGVTPRLWRLTNAS